MLTKEETEKYYLDYLNDLEILDLIYINFGEHYVSPTSIVHGSGKSRVNIQLPIQYREGRMLGVLHHEIGTHFLRKYNNERMPWNGTNRKKYDLRPSIATEEGLASINQMFDPALDPN